MNFVCWLKFKSKPAFNQELSKTVGEGWIREVAEKREVLRENEEEGSVVAELKKEEFPDQSPRQRVGRGVSYHRFKYIFNQPMDKHPNTSASCQCGTKRF